MKCLLALLFVPMVAFATNTQPPPPEPEPVTQEQQQDQAQGQDQAQAQGQDQAQDQSQTMGDQSNSQMVSFNSESYASSAIAPFVSATSPCVLGTSAALGLPQINIGGGKQRIDPECEKRETARMLGALGERELAVTLLCMTTAAVDNLGVLCKPNKNMAHRVTELEGRIQTLLNERDIDRAKCSESKSRIIEGCGK